MVEPAEVMTANHTLRILHLSDVHFRSADASLPEERVNQVKREAWKRFRVLGEENWSKNLAELTKGSQPIDLVCITGDVADWGLSQEYVPATAFVRDVLSRLELSADRLFVVPGNHDIHRKTEEQSWSAFRDATTQVPHASVSKWMAGGRAPFGVDPTLKAAVLERSRAYREWVEKELKRPELLPSHSRHGNLGYRISINLPGRPFPVHIVGLDSAWLSGDNNDNGKLLLTEDQIGLLATDGGTCLDGLRIALVHHPLTELADAIDSRQLLSEYVDLLLHGHQHVPLLGKWADPERSLLEFAAGCLYEGEEGHRYPNTFHVIDIVTNDRGRPLRHDVSFVSWSSRGYWSINTSLLYQNTKNGRLSLTAEKGDAGISSVSSKAEPLPLDKQSGVSLGVGLQAGGDVRADNLDMDVPENASVQVLTNVTTNGSIDLSNIQIRLRKDPDEGT